MSARVLIIDEQGVYRRLLAHHVSTGFDSPSIAEYDPVARGMLPADFSGSAYDAVLLGDAAGASGRPGLVARPVPPKRLSAGHLFPVRADCGVRGGGHRGRRACLPVEVQDRPCPAGCGAARRAIATRPAPAADAARRRFAARHAVWRRDDPRLQARQPDRREPGVLGLPCAKRTDRRAGRAEGVAPAAGQRLGREDLRSLPARIPDRGRHQAPERRAGPRFRRQRRPRVHRDGILPARATCGPASRAVIPPLQALVFLRQMAEALKVLHARGRAAPRPEARQRHAARRESRSH